MADLSEMSVVLALRDWQWRRAICLGVQPEPVVGLSGNAEKKVGDGLTGINDRLFLFEIKAKRANINDEWNRSPIKRALSKLESLGTSFVIRDVENMLDEEETHFHQSLQCHHFAFWAPDFKRRPKNSAPDQPMPGTLYISPYFLGVMAKCSNNIWKLIRSKFNKSYGLGHCFDRLPSDPPNSVRYIYDTESRLDEVGDQKTKLIRRTEALHSWSELGLPLEDFRKYVGYLCGKQDEQEAINVVIMDRDGKFFAHITSTNDLRSIFEPKDPDPEWDLSTEVQAKIAPAQLDRSKMGIAENEEPEPTNELKKKREFRN